MIFWYGDLDVVVAKFKSEFSRPEKFFISPTFIVGISYQSRKPLRKSKYIVPPLILIIREVFITTTRTEYIPIYNVKFKIN